ncbi:MAG: DNA repair exonuclease, partial [Actinomycetia bacterium]|nr:DNA repair exonuclease [Actinomycetes bacterium]
PPNEYTLNTPHYEEVDINFDPFKDKKPIEVVKDCFNNLHPKAKVILKVRGFINSEDIGMSEEELVKQIKKISSGKCIEDYCEFEDIRIILEDDLFKNFREKLKQTNYEEEKKMQMREMVIKAMMETQS